METKKKGTYSFLANGDIEIRWTDNGQQWQRIFGSVSKAVNFCRENNIEAYPC